MKFFKHGMTLALIGFLSLNTVTFAYDAMTSATQKEATPPKEATPVAPKKEAQREEDAKAHEEKSHPKEEKSLPQDPSVHIVVKGDTLTTIAKKYNLTLGALLRLNPSIKDSNDLDLGQRIVIKAAVVNQPIKSEATSKTLKGKAYENGIYRGSYLATGIEQVSLEFTLTEGIIKKVNYRNLSYKGVNFLKPSTKKEEQLKAQYDLLLQSLIGITIDEATSLLQTPEKLVKNLKTETEALKSDKILSAINNALERGLYKKK